MRPLALALILTALPLAAMAERVTSREAFLQAVEGRSLTRFGITLAVLPSGQISGRAFGNTVSGTWDWQAGWFCRTLAWGNRTWPRNCQLVEIEDGSIVFTADKGRGDRARLSIR